MNWMLIIVLVIILGQAFVGLKRGLIKTVFSIFSVIIVMVLTALISPKVGKVLQSNEKIFEYVHENVEELIPEGIQMDGMKEDTDLLKNLKLPEVIQTTLLKNNTESINEKLSTNNFKDYITNYLTCLVINAIGYVATFMVLTAIIKIVCNLVDIISKLPVLNTVNKIGGVAVGLVLGLLSVYVFFILITIFSGTQLGQTAFEMIERNSFLSMLYNNNILLGFILNASKIFL